MTTRITTVFDLQARVDRAATFAVREDVDGSVIVTLTMPRTTEGRIEMVAAPVTRHEAAQLEERFNKAHEA